MGLTLLYPLGRIGNHVVHNPGASGGKKTDMYMHAFLVCNATSSLNNEESKYIHCAVCIGH